MARLGMVLYHGLESGAALESYARAAETAGYESLWVTERYFHEETFTLLGFLAAVTQRLKLGVGVTNPYTRHPALLAMASATLDRVSGGRFILGMGRSEPFIIRDRLGLDYRQPRTVLAEAVGNIRDLLAGNRVDTTGGQVTMRDTRLAILPVQQPMPIYLAALGPQALRLLVPLPTASSSTPTCRPATCAMPCGKFGKPPAKRGAIPKPSTLPACSSYG